MKAIFVLLLMSNPVFAEAELGKTLFPKQKYEWVSVDPHVHSRDKDAQGCPYPASRTELLNYALQNGLQLLVDNYWGPHRPSEEELRNFPLSMRGKKTSEEKVHGNNHVLQLARDLTTGRPTTANLVEGLEVSWFIADRGTHLGIFGAKSLDWFYDQSGPEKLKSPFLILEALRKETDEHNRNLNRPNRHFVVAYHSFKWNPKGYPQMKEKDFGRPFEMPMSVAIEGWNVKGLGIEDNSSTNSAPDMANSPIDVGTFDAYVRLLNSGFKLSLIGGSDYSCLAHDDEKGPGSGLGKAEILRTLVATTATGNKLTYQDVLDAATDGRTIVANQGAHSPKLGRFEVAHGEERAGIGETLHIPSRNKSVLVDVRNLPPDARVLVNGGKAIRNFRGEIVRTLKGGSERLSNGSLRLTQSSWIVAHNEREITSAVYVELNGEPIRVTSEDPCYFIGHIERAKTELAKPSRDDLTISDYPEDQKAYLLKWYDEAQRVYVKRFNEAKLRRKGPSSRQCFVPIK